MHLSISYLNGWKSKSQFFLFNTFFEKKKKILSISKILLLLCHYGVLSVDVWGGGINLNGFSIKLQHNKKWRDPNIFWTHWVSSSSFMTTLYTTHNKWFNIWAVSCICVCSLADIDQTKALRQERWLTFMSSHYSCLGSMSHLFHTKSDSKQVEPSQLCTKSEGLLCDELWCTHGEEPPSNRRGRDGGVTLVLKRGAIPLWRPVLVTRPAWVTADPDQCT